MPRYMLLNTIVTSKSKVLCGAIVETPNDQATYDRFVSAGGKLELLPSPLVEAAYARLRTVRRSRGLEADFPSVLEFAALESRMGGVGIEHWLAPPAADVDGIMLSRTFGAGETVLEAADFNGVHGSTWFPGPNDPARSPKFKITTPSGGGGMLGTTRVRVEGTGADGQPFACLREIETEGSPATPDLISFFKRIDRMRITCSLPGLVASIGITSWLGLARRHAVVAAATGWARRIHPLSITIMADAGFEEDVSIAGSGWTYEPDYFEASVSPASITGWLPTGAYEPYPTYAPNGVHEYFIAYPVAPGY